MTQAAKLGRRRLAPIAVESVGQPMAVDGIAALLVARLRPAPALHVVTDSPDEQPSSPVSAVQQGPLRRFD